MMIEQIRNMPAKIKELNALYDYLKGATIKSPLDFSELQFDDSPTLTTIYSYEPEFGHFKVNHAGEYFNMKEEEMWKILENAIEVTKR